MSSERRLKILSLSAVYPTPREPNLGIFVKRRLERIAHLADVRVLAPVAAVDYAMIQGGRGTRLPEGSTRTVRATVDAEGSVPVRTVRWWYPPGGGVMNPPLLAMQLLPAARQIQREFDFDLLDAHFAYPTGVATAMMAARLNRPFTITLRGDETMHAARSSLRARAMDWSLRRAAAVFAVSNRLRDWAISRGGVDPDRVHTTPNGVDTAIFHRDPELTPERIRLARQFVVKGIGPNDCMVLSAGYLIERKGHHHLIRAVHELSKTPGGLLAKGGQIHVVIAGEPGREGNFLQTLQKLIDSLGMGGAVHLIGRQTPQQLAHLMNVADLLVLASSREGWPNVVQEALACGCPVVATDIGGTPDMIPDDRFGYLLPSQSGGIEQQLPSMLKLALERSMTSEWQRDAIAGFGGSRSWNQVALDVIQSLWKVLPMPAPWGSVE